MSATTMMLSAFGLAALGHWAHNKPVATAGQVVEAAFATLVVAALDRGATADVAKGFAALFLVAVILGPNSPLTAIIRASQTPELNQEMTQSQSASTASITPPQTGLSMTSQTRTF